MRDRRWPVRAAPAEAVRLQSAPLLEVLPPATRRWVLVRRSAQGTRSLDEHAATFSDPEEATPLLVTGVGARTRFA